MAMGQKRKGGGCLTMTSLALVCPYSDVAKSHVCQKETKGCQKERTGRKPALLPGPSMWDVMHAVTCRPTCITYHTKEDTSDCELHRSEPEPNCELHVARFSAVEIWLRSHRRFTTGFSSPDCILLPAFIASRENQKSYIFFMFLLIQSHPSM